MATLQQGSGMSGSIADDEAALRRGRGGVAGVLAVLFVLGAAGMWFLVSDGDDARVYGELGRQLNGLKQAQFDQFWGCALPGANLRDIKTNTELASQLANRARERGQAYGVHLREACVGKLTEIEPTLDSLIMPEDLREDVSKLKQATSKLRSASSAFVSYLDTPDFHYDDTAAGIYIDNITRGWFDFRQAHADLNKTLKTKLETR